MVIILMGVAGSGKTTVGRLVSARLGYPFYDGDDYHPPENLAKMKRGTPLDDEDRATWLARLRAVLDNLLVNGARAIIACSALKARYRETLELMRPGIALVFLSGDFDLIEERLHMRESHFMRASLLRSQFEALEEPQPSEAAVIVDVSQSPESIADHIVKVLGPPQAPRSA